MVVYHPDLINTLDVQEFVFFSEQAHHVFIALQDALSFGEKPDLLMMNDALHKRGYDKELLYLAGLEQPLSVANAVYYHDKLIEYARKKELKKTIAQMNDAIKDVTVTASELADKALESISEAMQKTATRESPIIENILPDYLDDLDKRMKDYDNGTSVMVDTGLRNVDALMGPMMGGELVVLAARPGCGKSALSQQIAEHVAMDNKIPAAYFSLEMSKYQHLDRMLASKEVISLGDLRIGKISKAQSSQIIDVCGFYHDIPLAIYDNAFSKSQIHSYMRREFANRGTKFFVIDYLGLMAGLGGDKDRARWEKVGEESSVLKRMARELDAVVMLCVQLNRDAEEQEPNKSMLRDSGEIEQNSDRIIFIYPDRDAKDDSNSEKRHLAIKIDKNRNGAVGKEFIMFDAPHVRMYVEKEHFA